MFDNENEKTMHPEQPSEEAVREVFASLTSEDLLEDTGEKEEEKETSDIPAAKDQEAGLLSSETETEPIVDGTEKTSLETVPAEEAQAGEQKEDGEKNWYVIHTYSGYENKVKDNLLKRIESMNMRDKIFKVLVPTEEEIEYRGGKKRSVQKKIYPGYVLVEMILGDDSWYVVRNTPGVTGFVGPSVKPTPVSKDEIKQILRLMGMESGARIKIALEKGQGVKVKSGPFKDFTGLVDEIYPEREKVKVLIFIFGRETPVELDFRQIEKL
ncbi:MAG: transcription termination/antitermination protein NusG [Armatimonadota bacterium]